MLAKGRRGRASRRRHCERADALASGNETRRARMGTFKQWLAVSRSAIEISRALSELVSKFAIFLVAKSAPRHLSARARCRSARPGSDGRPFVFGAAGQTSATTPCWPPRSGHASSRRIKRAYIQKKRRHSAGTLLSSWARLDDDFSFGSASWCAPSPPAQCA